MVKMMKALKCDLLRCVMNKGFILSAAVTAVLCFSLQVYADNSNGRVYSVLEALFSLDRSVMAESGDFIPAIIIGKALTGYSAMALPITAALPFVTSFIAERNSGNMRYTIVRAGRIRYYISKLFSALLSGGLAVLIGVSLFAVLVYILFPNTQPTEILEYYLPNGAFSVLFSKTAGAFSYGAASVLPAFFLCSFCTNTYIILCVPFLLKFIYETVLSAVQTNLSAAGNYEIYQQTMPLYPNAITYLFEMPFGGDSAVILALNLLLAAAAFSGFAAVMEKRADRGC